MTKVLFAAFEAVPFMKTGGLGDVAGSLPAALNNNGTEVRLILPKFSGIHEKYRNQMEHVADFRVDLGWRNLFCGIEKLEYNEVTCYFIDNEQYFYRDKPYGYFDDGERIAFFSKAIMESLQYIDFMPDIIHCNDWHTALVPVFLKRFYSGIPGYDRIRTVFTVHNIKFQGKISRFCTGDILGLSDEEAAYYGLIDGDALNYMRGALSTADRLTTVSPSYAEEVCTDFYGEGCQDIFRSRKCILSGILNGIDTVFLDPQKDPALPVHYTARTRKKKADMKIALQKELGLKEDTDKPLIAVVSRLTDQKGLDLLLRIIDELMQEDIQFVVLGLGEKKYEDKFRSMAAIMPDKFSACIFFDEALSHRIYAGADLVLVPSLFEPCGLTQMISMRYGSLPLVRETGGLKDSVIPYNKYTGEGNGFSFANYNAHELLFTIKDAIELMRNNKEAWDKMVRSAMNTDFSWSRSAKEYIDLYEDLS